MHDMTVCIILCFLFLLLFLSLLQCWCSPLHLAQCLHLNAWWKLMNHKIITIIIIIIEPPFYTHFNTVCTGIVSFSSFVVLLLVCGFLFLGKPVAGDQTWRQPTEGGRGCCPSSHHLLVLFRLYLGKGNITPDRIDPPPTMSHWK